MSKEYNFCFDCEYKNSNVDKPCDNCTKKKEIENYGLDGFIVVFNNSVFGHRSTMIEAQVLAEKKSIEYVNNPVFIYECKNVVVNKQSNHVLWRK